MHVSICLLCASATSTSAACVHKTLQLASSTASGEPQPLRIHARSVTGTRTRSWPISHSSCPAGGWARPPGRLLFLADGANRTEDGQHRFLARWIALEIDLERWSPAWLAWRRGSASRHHQADCSRGRGGGVRRGAPHRGARRRARRHRQRRSEFAAYHKYRFLGEIKLGKLRQCASPAGLRYGGSPNLGDAIAADVQQRYLFHKGQHSRNDHLRLDWPHAGTLEAQQHAAVHRGTRS